MYHDPSQKDKKRVVDTCIASLRAKENDEDVTFNPPSSVAATLKTGLTHFSDLAFLSEDWILKHFKLTPKAIGIGQRLVGRPNEDGSGVQQGIYVRLSDLDDLTEREIMALPKSRMWYEASRAGDLEGGGVGGLGECMYSLMRVGVGYLAVIGVILYTFGFK